MNMQHDFVYKYRVGLSLSQITFMLRKMEIYISDACKKTSLSCSKELPTRPYPEPVESSVHPFFFHNKF